jgi:hypothetical protein
MSLCLAITYRNGSAVKKATKSYSSASARLLSGCGRSSAQQQPRLDREGRKKKGMMMMR